MRDFFKSIVANLYTYCGNRQADKMTDAELIALYDALERVSKLYDYIPQERQKDIINNCLISDKEYQNINARLISKWLELNGKQYFKEDAHKPTEITSEPLTGQERDKWIEKFLNEISKATTNFTEGMNNNKGSGSRMKEHFESGGIKHEPLNKVSALDQFLQDENKTETIHTTNLDDTGMGTRQDNGTTMDTKTENI